MMKWWLQIDRPAAQGSHDTGPDGPHPNLLQIVCS
jgi:hypothetical protein